MPATVRYDAQYCPIARALDVLADRWTLLILREVMAGHERFSDIRDNLPGIAPGVLTARLRTMEEQQLIAVAGSQTRPRYVLGARGHDAVPVMRSLSKYGMPILEDPRPARAKRPWNAVQTCLVAYYTASHASTVRETYLICLNDEEFSLTSRGELGSSSGPVLRIELSPSTLFAIRKGLTSLSDAMNAGDVRVTGSKAALARFCRTFQLFL